MGKKYPPKIYPWGKLYPCYHAEKMPWASGVVINPFWQIIITISDGRDPNTDSYYKGVVVNGVKEQTELTLKKIKDKLDEMGTCMENIIQWSWYIARRQDWPNIWQNAEIFLKKNCPDLLENPRMGKLFLDVGLDLKEMVLEVEAIAVSPPEK